MVWVVIAVVVIVVVAAVWIGNTVIWTKRNNNLARKSPKLIGHGGPGIDDQNHTKS